MSIQTWQAASLKIQRAGIQRNARDTRAEKERWLKRGGCTVRGEEEAPVVVRVLLVSDGAQVAAASSVQTAPTGYADGWTNAST